MTEAEMVLYRRLAVKAKEWAKSKGLSDEYGMGALNAMWYTMAAALPPAPCWATIVPPVLAPAVTEPFETGCGRR